MANTYEIFSASAMYTWRRLRTGFVEALNNIHRDIPEETYRYFIDKKINNLNTPGNRDMLSLQFTVNGINLNAEEEKIIDLRNTFLHGGHPLAILKKDYKAERFGILYYIQLRLHFMINRLLLKYFGYNGYMVNYVRLH